MMMMIPIRKIVHLIHRRHHQIALQCNQYILTNHRTAKSHNRAELEPQLKIVSIFVPSELSLDWNTCLFFYRTVDPEPIEPIKEENPTEWWMPLCPEEELNNVEQSAKLMLLFSILADCEACGDKLLVFSQSLFSLDVIEHFLAMIDENTQNPNPDAKLGGFTGNWSRGVDYFRLDGSTNIETRNTNCINFNSEENSQARYLKTNLLAI